VNGVANRGGGGGGGGSYGADTALNGGNGGNGGSGVVIIRYPDTFRGAAATTGSPQIIQSGGYWTYIFTGSGSITI
jgi:hypothetical protein